MDIEGFTSLAKIYGYNLDIAAKHDHLRYIEGFVFKARGKRTIPVWETICADGQAHIETFRPPEFINDWVFEGDGNYGAFCGLYDDDEEDEFDDEEG